MNQPTKQQAKQQEKNVSTINAIRIDVDGTTERISFEDGCEPLQELVGGYIEAIYSGREDLTFWGNDEAKLLGLPVNRAATLLWWMTTPAMRNQDVICGTAVITGGADEDGNTLSVPEDFAELVKGLLP